MHLQSLHTRLLVDDYRACFLFYQNILGLRAGFGDEGSGYADFSVGDTAFSLFSRQEMAEALGPSVDGAGSASDRVALILGVANVDEVAADLRSKGVILVAEPEDHPDWGIRTAHFRDPDGTLIEINAPIRHG